MRRAGLGLMVVLSLASALALAPPHAQTRASTPTGDPVIAAAGDIACVRVKPNIVKHTCYGRDTATLILSHPEVDRVLTLGDNQYPCGSAAEFTSGYNPTWGQFLASTQPTIGNHEYQTSLAGCDAQASGYFQYFGSAAVGPLGQPANGQHGYYYYDIAGTGTPIVHWRVIVLNANCAIESCANGSPQEQFLQSAISTAPLGYRIMASWHQPYLGGSHLSPVTPGVKPFWNDLLAAHAALVLNGHAHYYARYAPQLADRSLDPAGLTEIIAGAGGASLGTAKVTSAMASYQNTQYGVLFLTLHASSFSWQFIDIDGVLRDSGTQLLPPLISDVSPTSGSVGTVVTINGSGFNGATAVTFNGTPAISRTVDSDTQITATVPNSATTGKVCVTARGTTGCSAGDFTLTPPVVSVLNPTSGPVGTVVTVTGSGFSDATAVTFNGTAAISRTVDSDTQITATVPNAATTGKVCVTARGDTGCSGGNFAVT